MNIKSIITAAIALLISTACSGGAKQEKVAPLAYAASPINGDAQIFKKHANDLKGKAVIPFTTHEGSALDHHSTGCH